MTQEKLVSVAMATYNGEKYLKEQLDSIFAQTYKNIEVIVTDDCSTDKTVEILEEYSQKYNLKYYKNEENFGFVKNFEKAITLCNGDYIALSDQDDIWETVKVETLVNELGENLLIASNSKIIDENNNITKEFFIENVSKSPSDYKTDILFENFVQGSASLFKKELIKEALPFIDNVYHDIWLGFCAANSGKLKFINKLLMRYRVHQENASGLKYNGILGKLQALFFDKKTKETYKKDALQKTSLMKAIIEKENTNEDVLSLAKDLYNYNYYLLNFSFNKDYFNSLIFEFNNQKRISKKPFFIVFSWLKRIVL